MEAVSGTERNRGGGGGEGGGGDGGAGLMMGNYRGRRYEQEATREHLERARSILRLSSTTSQQATSLIYIWRVFVCLFVVSLLYKSHTRFCTPCVFGWISPQVPVCFH